MALQMSHGPQRPAAVFGPGRHKFVKLGPRDDPSKTDADLPADLDIGYPYYGGVANESDGSEDANYADTALCRFSRRRPQIGQFGALRRPLQGELGLSHGLGSRIYTLPTAHKRARRLGRCPTARGHPAPPGNQWATFGPARDPPRLFRKETSRDIQRPPALALYVP